MIVLEELKQKLNRGEIVSGDGGEVRKEKLRDVRNMYERKYTN